jgi:hypothetical protein
MRAAAAINRITDMARVIVRSNELTCSRRLMMSPPKLTESTPGAPRMRAATSCV